MLNLTTAFGRNGLQDWILQRVTAVILATYAILLLTFWFLTPSCDPIPWQILFSLRFMRYFSLLALISVMIHAWIGFWIVSTDYIKRAGLRLATEVFVYCCLLFEFIWAIQILWGY